MFWPPKHCEGNEGAPPLPFFRYSGNQVMQPQWLKKIVVVFRSRKLVHGNKHLPQEAALRISEAGVMPLHPFITGLIVAGVGRHCLGRNIMRKKKSAIRLLAIHRIDQRMGCLEHTRSSSQNRRPMSLVKRSFVELRE